MKLAFLAAALAAGLAASALRGDEAAYPKLKGSGFLQVWAGAGENARQEVVNAGVLVKRFRFKLAAEAAEGLSVVLVPELAGGFSLLDAYVALDLGKGPLSLDLPLVLTAGQFKTPFGLNRMYGPPQLSTPDYSRLYNGAGGVLGHSSYWDDGLMLTYKPLAWAKVDLAWVEGLGPNLATPGGNAYGTKADQDAVGRVELSPFGPWLKLGASAYYGQGFSAPGVAAFPNQPKLVAGGHLRAALEDLGSEAEVEFANREVDRGGLTVTLAQGLLPWLQAAAMYDHVGDYRSDKLDHTRILGGLNLLPGHGLRLSLMQEGASSGPSQAPVNSRTIIQLQSVW